jgi:hypothetical protein
MNIIPKDATSLQEKIIIVAAKVIPVICFLVLQLSAWQVFNNDYSKAVKAAPFALNLLGQLFVAGSVTWVVGMMTDKNWITKSDTANAIIAGASMAFGFVALMGF